MDFAILKIHDKSIVQSKALQDKTSPDPTLPSTLAYLASGSIQRHLAVYLQFLLLRLICTRCFAFISCLECSLFFSSLTIYQQTLTSTSYLLYTSRYCSNTQYYSM